jgi:hypothetical protein
MRRKQTDVQQLFPAANRMRVPEHQHLTKCYERIVARESVVLRCNSHDDIRDRRDSAAKRHQIK